jgi:dihydropyrimidine dehydrogenase (NADP+)
MPDLSVHVNGLKLPNPFMIASGPPGTNANVISKAFDEGWGGVVCKTVCLEADKIINVAPRYARMRAQYSKEVIGWENIELISDRSIEVWEDEFKRLKDEYPDRVLIASVMEEYGKDRWFEIIERCAACGVDGFELNFSCPHGLPERAMGAAMGQNPELLREVCAWVREATELPYWAKMTPNITHITEPARASLESGADGISAINTILSVMSVNLETLRPEPTVEGYSLPGGYSGKAVRPIALRMVMELAQMMHEKGSGFEGRSISAIGGVESGEDAAQFILLGASTVQVCTGVMIHGYGHVQLMCDQLEGFMEKHGFSSIESFRGHALRFFSTHADLVDRQREAREQKKLQRTIGKDTQWEGDRFVEQSNMLVSNK